MAHIEFNMTPLYLIGEVEDMQLDLDCWRATLVWRTQWNITGVPTIDGIPWNFLAASSADQTDGVERIELGGAYLNGVPINMRHTLKISIKTIDVFQMLVIRQYYVP